LFNQKQTKQTNHQNVQICKYYNLNFELTECSILIIFYYQQIIVIFAIFALTFAAPEPKPKAEAKADPGIYAAAYTVPTASVYSTSYHGHVYASPYASYVASPYVASPYVAAAYTAPLYFR
jgi:hypothetical protein